MQDGPATKAAALTLLGVAWAMLGFFRRMIRSKVGAVVALLFLGLVAFAFAAGDIERRATGSGFFGASDSTAASVGSETLSTAELQSRVQRVFDANRQQSPQLTMGQFLGMGGFQEILGQLVDGVAMKAFANDEGMKISKKLVDAEIASIPAFQGATGQFNQDQFRQLLAREKISEVALRDDIARQILERQLLQPATANGFAPKGMVQPYASMLLEKREGRIAIIPSAAFIPKIRPDDKILTAFYARIGDRFTLPEQRRMRYAFVDASRFAGKVASTDAEIGQYYKANASAYASSEARTVEQLVLQTEAAAKALGTKVGAGSLSAAAQGAGLSTITLPSMSKNVFAAQTSDTAAGLVFSASKDALVGPVKTGLGWALYRVTDIKTTPAKTLDSVKPEIVAKLTQTKIQTALSELANKLDGDIGNGSTFDQIVKDNGLTAAETPMLTADGRDLSTPQAPDPNMAPIAKAGFAMDQGDDPQIVPVVPDQRIAIVAVSGVTAAGPPPFAKVRPLVERAWLIDQGAIKAKALADKLQKASGSQSFDAVIASAGIPMPPVQKIGAQRSELGQKGQQIPPPMIALFSMKQGGTRTLPLQNDQGFGLIHLDTIIPGDASKSPQILSATGQGLSNVLTNEYAAQFRRAIAAHVGVKRNEAAIARVEAEMRKGSTPQ